MKRCSRCSVEKPLSEFSKDRSRPGGHTHRCKPCDSAKARGWQKGNPEQYRESSQRWVDDNRVRANAYSRAYQTRSRVKRAEADRLRRRRAGRGLTAQDRSDSLRRRVAIAFDPCFYCGGREDRMADDHFFALSKGGTDLAINLVRACHTCNTRKHNHCGTWMLLKVGANGRHALAVAG